MTTLRTPVLLALLIFVTACVTINVYFPAAAAQEAADRIINRVYGTEGEGEAPVEPAAPAQPQPQPQPQPQSNNDGLFMPVLASALDWLIAPAEAAEPNIDIKSPAIQSITAGMEARHPSLAPHYASGAVGMTRDGQIVARDLNSIPLRDRSRVQQLIADENKDRTALYSEIARANGHPEWGDEIRATFARRWVANAPGGWWYQDAGGGWKQK
ncbi:MAG: YdbL family protein [Gammaproteobacteria bacterium]|nr:YdbL family protein [Gammaproteobacteria bacterium]